MDLCVSVRVAVLIYRCTRSPKPRGGGRGRLVNNVCVWERKKPISQSWWLYSTRMWTSKCIVHTRYLLQKVTNENIRRIDTMINSRPKTMLVACRQTTTDCVIICCRVDAFKRMLFKTCFFFSPKLRFSLLKTFFLNL